MIRSSHSNIPLDSTRNAHAGDGEGYTEIEGDGTLRADGDATVWNDINLSSAMLGTGANAPTSTAIGSTGLQTMVFTGTGVQVNEVFGSVEVLHDYKEGSDIIPHLHWTPTTASTGNVKWQLEYEWVNRLGNLDTSTTIFLTEAAGGTAWIEKRTSFPTVDGTGMLIGSRFIFRLFRNPADASDTYGDGAGLLDFGVHYEIDTIGSRDVVVK